MQYGLGSIPFGGFVSLPQMVDMEGIEGKVEGERKEKLPPITPLDKIIVAFAGPLFSFGLACIFAVLAWGLKYPQPEHVTTTHVGAVVEGGAAEAAGIKPGDKIKSIGGVEIESFYGMGNSVLWQVVSAPIGPSPVIVERDGKEVPLTVNIPEPEVAEVKGGFFKRLLAKIFRRPPLPQIGVDSRISPVVRTVAPNSPAEAGGFKPGDVIIEFNGKKPYVHDIMSQNWTPGKAEVFKVQRFKKTVDITVVPRPPEVWEVKKPDRKKPMIGLVWEPNGIYRLDSDNPVEIVKDGATSIYKTLSKVFNPNSKVSGSHLSGAVGISRILYNFLGMEDGWKRVIFFGALLNINLAILNLLPFPVLDGGHIVMATAEWIRKKPLPVKFLLIVQNLFVYLLFGFMIFITFKDVGDFGGGGKKEKPDKIEWTALEKS